MELNDLVEIHQEGARSRKRRGWICGFLPDGEGVRIRTTDGFYVVCRNLDYCRKVPMKAARLPYVDD